MSDISQIHAQLDTHSDWFVKQSATKCGLWIEAATQMLGHPEESKRQGSGVGASLRMNHEQLRAELLQAKSWYANNLPSDMTSNSPSIVGVDFSEMDQRQ